MPSSRVWNAVPPPPRKTRRLISAHHPPTLFFLLSASCTSRQRKGSYCVCCVGYNIDSGRFVLASVAHTSDRAASSHPSEVPPHQTACHHLSHIAVAIIALALAVHVLNPILSLPTPAAPPPPRIHAGQVQDPRREGLERQRPSLPVQEISRGGQVGRDQEARHGERVRWHEG